MAAKRNNGPVLVTLVRSPEHELGAAKLSCHINGHILQHRNGGWKQWAIVPIDGMGSVVSWLERKGFHAQD